MGTRHMIAIYADGEYRVAQYGQWDGYPEGQGLDCLQFLREKMNESFREKVLKCTEMSDDEYREIFRRYGGDKDGAIRFADYDRLSKDYPQLSRDTSSEILELIQNSGGLKLRPDLEFIADGLYCEWAYVIDLDKNTFEVYEGFNKKPLTEDERFYFLEPISEELEFQHDLGYHPAKFVHSWNLGDLPGDDEFINTFKEEEDEE